MRRTSARRCIYWPHVLRPGGRLSLAETVVRHAQRLYDLVDLAPLGDDLQQRVIEAEEQIYANPDDPLVNWDVKDLQSALVTAGFEEVVVEEQVQEAEMIVSKATLERWFATEPQSERLSYAQHLLHPIGYNGITGDELALVQAVFEGQLANQTIPWRTRLAFVVGRVPLVLARAPNSADSG